MAFWAVEVKPGEPYVHESSSRGRLRITQATLGNLESVGWSTVSCNFDGMVPVKLCALNSTSGMYRLDLEYDEKQNVVFSVIGDSSVHLTGYYKIPDAAATHVHGIAQEHNALDTEVHKDGTNQMVRQADLNAAANVQVLVTQSQEADDHDNTHAHDIAWGSNALETEVHNDDPKQMVGKSGLNVKISDEASLGSGHCPVYKEDVGGPIDELEIEELIKLEDCNAEMASDGKKVKVKYIGRLKDGNKVIDPPDGCPATFKFTLGAHKVIAGWEQGIKGMRVGEKRKLTIPPALAYKDEPQKEMIPANSWLVYEIELLEVSEPGEEKPKKKSRLASGPGEEKPKKKSRLVSGPGEEKTKKKSRSANRH